MQRCSQLYCSTSAAVPRGSLLGYQLRRAAAMEMFYGGVRVQHLAQAPFPIRTTLSENLPLPSLQQERDDLELEVKDSSNNIMGLRVLPVNIGIRARNEAVRVRSEDCLRRLLAQKRCAALGIPLRFPIPSSCSSDAQFRKKYFHPPSSELSLLTRPADYCEKKTTPGIDVYNPRVWWPLQVLKPMGHNWSPALRSAGVRGPHMQLLQERIDKKGFGWKRKSRSLWQQDIDTAGFRPKRFF
ncbi:hypothetical protein ERJ75_000960800 [Trypanosoma vivax]|uniref:Uncharacterized protein n=1 Tax=Trypanosoma vivax (strain Y486) TaxID=1055687 RepID=G0U4W5_TRYVY|nr:hypothetical protein TRVL_03907 [Trypanosoma vivax]KAH8611937.1 hypothetical protein ERJ75_000960800 [Trypanosoma vivax]CCC52480.1 conserved hypothetical protein [Trypanosoma vivax Y486]